MSSGGRAVRSVRSRRSEQGATAVEFALVLIPLLVIIFGIVQYGLYFWAMQGGSDIARSAARLSAVGNPAQCNTVGTVKGFVPSVRDQIDNLAGSPGSAVIKRSYETASGTALNPPTDQINVGDQVKVEVRFKSVNLHFPFLPFIDDGWVTSHAEARVDFVPTQPQACS